MVICALLCLTPTCLCNVLFSVLSHNLTLPVPTWFLVTFSEANSIMFTFTLTPYLPIRFISLEDINQHSIIHLFNSFHIYLTSPQLFLVWGTSLSLIQNLACFCMIKALFILGLTRTSAYFEEKLTHRSVYLPRKGNDKKTLRKHPPCKGHLK